MKKKILPILLTTALSFLLVYGIVSAVTTVFPIQGGTGSSITEVNPGDLLVGSSTQSFTTVASGTVGYVLTSTSSYPFVAWEASGAGGGITSLNGLSGDTQTFASSSGTGFNIVSSETEHTFTYPGGSNGQVLLGVTGLSPTFATLNCDNGLTCTAGAGTLEIDVDDSYVLLAGDTSSGNYTWTGAHDFGGATSIEVPNGAGGTTVNAIGECTIDSTSRTWNCYTNNSEQVLGFATSTLGKVGIASPTASEDFGFGNAIAGATVTKVSCWNSNTTGNTFTFNIGLGSGSNETFTSDHTCTATSTPELITINGSSTISSGELIRFKTSAASSSGAFVQVDGVYTP